MIKSFKQRQTEIDEGLLDGVLNLGSKFLFFWKNLWLLNTKHGLDRIIQRTTLTTDDIKTLFINAIEQFKTMTAKAGDEILFFSKSLNQGFVSGVDANGNLSLITFLPPGRSFPKPGTEKVVVEDMNGTIIEFKKLTIVEIE